MARHAIGCGLNRPSQIQPASAPPRSLLKRLLPLLFPEVFIILGLGYVLFYIVAGIAYLIYIFFIPIIVIGGIIFIVYALSNKKNSQKLQANKPKDAPKQPLLSENIKSTDYDTDISPDNFNGPEEDDDLPGGE